MNRLLHLLLITVLHITGCKDSPPNTTEVQPDSVVGQQNTVTEKHEEEGKSCKFENGIHSATVGYYNPKTKYSTTYELEVHVSGCKVVRIDFPKGGWLDEDHIQPTKIDVNNDVTLEDDKGKIWKVHLH